MNLLPTLLTSEITNDPSTVATTDSVVKPSINEAANQNKLALIITIKSPRVRKVIGNVISTKKGFTRTFNIPKITAAIIAGYTPVTFIPGISSETTSNVRATSRILVIILSMITITI